MYRFAHQRLKVYFMFNFSLLASRAKAQHHANESLSYRRFGLIKSFILSCDLIFTEDNQLKEKLFACKSCADEDKHIQAGSETSSFVIKTAKLFIQCSVFLLEDKIFFDWKTKLSSVSKLFFSPERESEKLKLETNKNFLHHATYRRVHQFPSLSTSFPAFLQSHFKRFFKSCRR